MLEFNIKNQTISRVDRFDPATDSVDYLTAKFNFITDDWDGKTKKALFRSGTVSYEAAINSSGVCTVPWEVLVSPENKFSALSGGMVKMFVSVVGTSGTIQIPTKECRVEMSMSGLTESLNGAEPTPTVYEQLVAEVKAASEDIKAYDESIKNNYANAFKGTASGEVVKVDDVSPIEHTVKARVYGKNLCPVNVFDGANSVVRIINSTGILVEKGKKYTLSCNASYVSDIATDKRIQFIISSDKTQSGSYDAVNQIATVVTTSINEVGTFFRTFEVSANGYLYMRIVAANVFNLENIQLEEGETVTEYTPYIDPTTVTLTRYGADETDNAQTYTPNADGTVNVKSLSPTMTLLTDTEGVTVDLEYNRDTTAVMGDLKACLSEVKAIHQTTLDLLGGAS